MSDVVSMKQALSALKSERETLLGKQKEMTARVNQLDDAISACEAYAGTVKTRDMVKAKVESALKAAKPARARTPNRAPRGQIITRVEEVLASGAWYTTEDIVSRIKGQSGQECDPRSVNKALERGVKTGRYERDDILFRLVPANVQRQQQQEPTPQPNGQERDNREAREQAAPA